MGAVAGLLPLLVTNASTITAWGWVEVVLVVAASLALLWFLVRGAPAAARRRRAHRAALVRPRHPAPVRVGGR